MKIRKILTMALAALLALSCVSALAFNETGYPICDETITVTLSAPTPGSNLDWSEFPGAAHQWPPPSKILLVM